MKDEEYEKIGFKAGLEIHQQLDSNKLFCNCPSILRSDNPLFEIKRNLHLVAGESGIVDLAAKYQHQKGEDFFYQGYDTTCLVELDEEPPHKINEEALEIAIEIALLFNCELIPISQIMRKTVIDGSNTSGFQRTVMIARNGYFDTSHGKVRIDSIYLEEDSCRLIKKEEGSVFYRLDRLGIPLVEISTKPDLKNASHVKEAALKIGEILRSSRVRRGIGTIRQDLNISIKNSNRVEIKGFQDPNIMEKCVEMEVLRQKKILDSGQKNQSEVRNCLPDGNTEFLRPMPGSHRMYPETDLELLKISREKINLVKKNLPRLRREIQDDLKSKGLSEEMIHLLFKYRKLNEFKELYSLHGNAPLIGKLLLVFPKEIASREKRDLEEIESILNLDVLSFVLDKIYKDRLHMADLKQVLERVVSGMNIEEAIKLNKPEIEGIREKIFKLIKDKPGLSINAYMGLIMKDFKGQISGEEATKIINQFLKQ